MGDRRGNRWYGIGWEWLIRGRITRKFISKELEDMNCGRWIGECIERDEMGWSVLVAYGGKRTLEKELGPIDLEIRRTSTSNSAAWRRFTSVPPYHLACLGTGWLRAVFVGHGVLYTGGSRYSSQVLKRRELWLMFARVSKYLDMYCCSQSRDLSVLGINTRTDTKQILGDPSSRDLYQLLVRIEDKSWKKQGTIRFHPTWLWR